MEYHYQLQVCYRGVVRARLVQVALADGAENDLLHFDSTAYPPAHTFVANVATTTDSSTPMDFVNFAYYVEATLSASAIVVGNPAEIAVIKVYPSSGIPRLTATLAEDTCRQTVRPGGPPRGIGKRNR